MTLREILKDLGEDYYPWHEYGDQYVSDNIKTLDKAEQAIKDLIAKEIIGKDEDLNAPLDREIDWNPEIDIIPDLYLIRRAARNIFRKSQRNRLEQS
jgi:hypothetical protein